MASLWSPGCPVHLQVANLHPHAPPIIPSPTPVITTPTLNTLTSLPYAHPLTPTLQNTHFPSHQLLGQLPMLYQDHPLTKTADTFSITVNGKQLTLTSIDPEMTLNEFLRDRLGLKGTKKSCGEGGCGACTVAVAFATPNGLVKSVPINSCLRLLASCNGAHVTTVEGLGSAKRGYHPIQRRLADANGTQCGYCSPGMVMHMYGMMTSGQKMTLSEIEKEFDGNICRCTGYRPILDAMKSFAPYLGDDNKTNCTGNCANCPSAGACHHDDGEHDHPHLQKEAEKRSQSKEEWKKVYPDMEDLHHLLPSLSISSSESKSLVTPPKPLTPNQRTMSWSSNGVSFVAPTSLPVLFSILNSSDPSTTSVIVGNTSTGIYKDQKPSLYVSLELIPDLSTCHVVSNGVVIGAAVVINDLIALLNKNLSLSTTFPTLVNHLYKVANSQIRNAGSVAGNLMLVKNYPFPSDIFTIMCGVGASITVAGSNQSTTIPLSELINYDMTRKIIVSLNIPFSHTNQHFRTYKTGIRHVNSHALVNAAFSMDVDPSTQKVLTLPTLVVGGIYDKPIRLTDVENYLVNQNLSDVTLAGSLQLINKLTPPANPDDRFAYKKWLVCADFYKFFLSALPTINDRLRSATEEYTRAVSRGEQFFDTNPDEYPVSKPIVKLTARQQTAGEAEYTGDIREPSGTLHAAFVLASIASGEIDQVDASAALALPGVVDLITANDIPGPNANMNGIELLSSGKILYHGQAVALIVAESQRLADRAAKLVNVSYKNVQTPILTLEDAVAKGSFFPVDPSRWGSPVTVGDVDKGFAESDVVIEGSVSCGSQAHFHMETHTALVIPNDDGSFQVMSANQFPTALQNCIASTLQVNVNHVTVEVKRCGGGYGGKGSNAAAPAQAVSVAANKLGRPVKIVMDLNTNMRMLGKRHPFLANYKVGVTKDGVLNAIKFDAYCDGGCALQDSDGTTFVFLSTLDNAYFCPNFYAESKICQTNSPSNTYTRGPGWIPGVYVADHVMEHVARTLGKPTDEIKRMNFYKKNQITPRGATLKYFNLDVIWDQLKVSSGYSDRMAAIELYNKSNKWMKKGISMVPVKFMVSWQGDLQRCFINIYADGTLDVSHSGVEIGQGIHTKVAQAVAYRLAIPIELIRILPTNTVISPNSSDTGGSVTSGLACAAALKVSDVLNDRLAPVRKQLGPNATWQQIVAQAASQGISLQASDVNVPGPAPLGATIQYFSYSAIVSEVTVDILTGELQIERADILFDAGQSLSPLIDIGQVEGAFMMGAGYYMTEEVKYDKSGALVNDGTWEYKPFSALDIPLDLRVTLLKKAPNPVGVLGSKCTGEPPLALACSILFAVRDAVRWSRLERGAATYMEVNAPATVDAVQATALTDISDLTLVA